MTPVDWALAVVVVLIVLGAVFLRFHKNPPLAPLPSADAPGAGCSPPVEDYARISGLTLHDAEDLLDWLERNGYQDRGLRCEANKLFAVEFRVDEQHPFVPSAIPHRGLVNLTEAAKARPS
jgi:hypothetical protein